MFSLFSTPCIFDSDEETLSRLLFISGFEQLSTHFVVSSSSVEFCISLSFNFLTSTAEVSTQSGQKWTSQR